MDAYLLPDLATTFQPRHRGDHLAGRPAGWLL